MEDSIIKKLILSKNFLIVKADYQLRLQKLSLNMLMKDKASVINFQSFSKTKTFLDAYSNVQFSIKIMKS